MAKATRLVEVHKLDSVSPNMLRVTLGGDALKGFPEGFEGGYIKLILPDRPDKPAARSYTVVEYRPEERALVFDMVAHGDGGPAARWAKRVRVGDDVTISGPGACKRLDPTADWFLVAGDMSALPAITVNLETLPETARGHVVLEVMSDADKPRFDLPPGLRVHWIVNPDPDSENTRLEDTVKALPWQDGRLSAWVAGEFSASRALRQYFRHSRAVPKDDVYVSCYWKIGVTDEGMKAAKRADAEAW